MCVRYTLRKPHLAEVAAELEVTTSFADEALYKPRYNAAPTDIGWIVCRASDRRTLLPARWKYLIGANRMLANIRSESVTFSRFRDVFSVNRCAIATDGFFVWPRDGLDPVWFHLADDGLLFLGGLFQTSRAAGAYPRFSVLTTPPNPLVAKFNDRMPVVVPLKKLDDWLTATPEEALNMVVPSHVRGLVATRVSDYVTNLKHDDPGCIAPPS